MEDNNNGQFFVKGMCTVEQIAAMFNVTDTSVRNWISEGLVHKKEKLIGRRTRIIINPNDVILFHKAKEVK